MGRGGGSGNTNRRSTGGGSHTSSRSFGGGRGNSPHRGPSVSSRGGGMPRVSSRNTPPPALHTHVHVGGPRVSHHYGGYDPAPPHRSRTRRSGVLPNILLFFTGLVVILAIAAALSYSMKPSSNTGADAAKSTVRREALTPDAAFDPDCLDDNAGWITDPDTLLAGMEEFYKKTGIQPALAIYEEIDGEKYLTDSEVERFMGGEYDSLLKTEKGILLLFLEYEDSDYYVYYMAGADAQTIMDREACGILVDYVNAFYESDYSDEEYFAQVFMQTGERIMTVTPTMASTVPTVVAGILVIAALIAVIVLIKMKHKRAAEQAAETERILNAPIDRL